ncbi:PQQ-binding-like beta-propeller repeat protein [Streptomyces sp. NPDC017943]|uniref:outer membrane protein assembly factor BamB family protein n=1 Tax=Streptomyces sp. NPDC017943 TaxID=3365019 RepID=UPI0037AB79BA
MTTEQVEAKVRETLHAVDLDGVRAPGDLVERVVRRRGRRRFSQAAGATVAVVAIAAGAVFGLGDGGAGGHERPARPAATRPATPPDGWKPWQGEIRGAGERGCLVDGGALYCAGSRYDVAKFDAGTGKRQWTVAVNREGGGIDHPFAARDGVVYAYRNHTAENLPDGDYAGGTDLMAVDGGSGEVLWKAEMPQDDRTGQAALLIDGAVLANTPTIRTMSALDPHTGAEKWRFSWAKGTVCERAAVSGVPHLLCTRDTEEPHDTDVLRLDPATGRATKVTTLDGRADLVGTSGGRMVLLASKGGAGKNLRLITVSGSGKQTSWPYRVGPLAALEVAGDRVVSLSRQGAASVFSLSAGRSLWTRPAGVEVPGPDAFAQAVSPVVSERQGVVYFADDTGNLSALDLLTGERVWRGHADIGTPGSGSAGSPQLLLHEDALIVRNGPRTVSLLPRTGG